MAVNELHLTLLLTELRNLADRHRRDLAEPVRLMDGHAWVGPSARRFDAELRHQQRRLQSALTAALDALHRKQATLPTIAGVPGAPTARPAVAGPGLVR
ncbi:hypothetical protein GCM10027589_27060 [Actinocorallia lasiicapitis]